MTEEQLEKLNKIKVDPDKFQNLERLNCGKILGIDYGTKNVGLALSDQEQKQAFVYDTLKMSDKLFVEIKEICDKEEVDRIVVGLPLNLKGEYTQKTEEVVMFIGQLEEEVKIAVEFEDERFSSTEAEKRGGGHGIDESSAQIILQQYLDKLNN